MSAQTAFLLESLLLALDVNYLGWKYRERHSRRYGARALSQPPNGLSGSSTVPTKAARMPVLEVLNRGMIAEVALC